MPAIKCRFLANRMFNFGHRVPSAGEGKAHTSACPRAGQPCGWHAHLREEPQKKVTMNVGILLLLVLLCGGPLRSIAHAQSGKDGSDMNTVRVRYMVNELDPAVAFYTEHFGFKVKAQNKPNFAMLSRGNLELVLSTPYGPGGAAKPMLNGQKAQPGGWNRIILNVNDLQAEVARLRKAGLHFRNDIASGPGGSEILVDDPSGNPVELFQPSR